jgi:hypothetical protein
MRLSLVITLLGLALAGCAGPDGNMARQPYADEPGGAMAVKPQAVGHESYDPNTAPYDAGEAPPTPNPPPAPIVSPR